ncbi:MAG: helix-turn-helix transcriptional regulator [Veillonellaceae bacterium]|uniref:helix-turn-helix transcriptional regulator n=1 Tax=uncultured Selenomonas sp. TaxID=159275 RepID=UPI0025EF09D1|nr:helix-turn-helix transcriptional regulator [uncultured Selenomonas sp.]MDD6699160.1 helix-turn-helix transcriptional regulator [Veillonellaceae bacterium]
MPNRNDIAERLRALRGDKSRAEVAEACGISISALTMYEIGERVPRDEVKTRLAKLYGKTVEEIFFAE